MGIVPVESVRDARSVSSDVPSAIAPQRPSPATTAGMLVLVYVAWGSTSPAMKVAVASIPPFWMAAIRFAGAGGLLWLGVASAAYRGR